MLPIVGILYIREFTSPSLVFKSFPMHEFAMAVATVEGGFVTFIAYLCYRDSREPFLRWLTLGFGSFTILYAPHGPLTVLADSCLRLFLIFGPASRLAMAIFLLAAVLAFGRASSQQDRSQPGWGWWWAAMGGLAAVLSAGSLEWPQEMLSLHLGMEHTALALSLLSLTIMLVRRVKAPMMTRYFAIAVAFFAQSSWAFLQSAPWNHMWWYAHGIFAAGFTILSYGVVVAFWTTKDFSKVLTEEQMLEITRHAQEKAESALRELRVAHENLQVLASTDPLTGALNRREFQERTEQEMAKARRSGAALSLVFLDLDHFKRINDTHGHLVGDDVLKALVSLAKGQLRPGDIIGRMGGEEFAILLPYTAESGAVVIAERLRQALAASPIAARGGVRIPVTASLGVACWDGEAGQSYQNWLAIADRRLYAAKAQGRDRVVVEG
ncbi:GGDEF domain-containing protein [Paramagnetospirillum marisnigri]|nr:diguanylate cyclase [Paramagnetospirillum marisnigri]